MAKQFYDYSRNRGQRQTTEQQVEVTPVNNIAPEDEQLVDLGEKAHEITDFFEAHKKNIMIGGGAIVGIALLALAYFFLMKAPAEKAAADEIFRAELLFQQDSFQKAIAGDSAATGLLDVANNYGRTAAGNNSHYYLGISCLQTGDFKGAIQHLESYSASGELMPAMTYGALGDAYAEQYTASKSNGDLEQALKNYEKAANASDNSLTAPYNLWKAGLVYEKLGQNDKAAAAFTRIKNEFPRSAQGEDIELFIARVGK